ncbi:MAG: CdaR family protein [bacterium]
MRALFLEHLPIKVVALILAVSLVIIKHEEQIALVTVSVPVRVVHPSNRVLVSPVADKVLVTVEGRYGDLESLDIPALDVRLTGLEGNTYAFERDLFKVPPGLRVREVRPPAMLLRFEEKMADVKPVRPDLHGEPAEGFRLVGVEVIPPTVKVEGAASAVSRLGEVLTDRIDLVGRNQSVTLDVELTKPPEYAAFLHGNQVYQVKLVIEERTDTRVVDGIAIAVRGEPQGSPGYEVSPPTADVTLQGPVRLLRALDPDHVEVFVNVAGANPNRRILKSRVVDAAAPPGLTLVEVRPGKVTLVQRDPPPEPEVVPEPGADAGVP